MYLAMTVGYRIRKVLLVLVMVALVWVTVSCKQYPTVATGNPLVARCEETIANHLGTNTGDRYGQMVYQCSHDGAMPK